LGIAYWNANRDGTEAQKAYEKAVGLAPSNMRIRYEQDQLLKKCEVSPAVRLEKLSDIKNQLIERDDFCVEYASLLNLSGQFEAAKALMDGRNFHPWEGGEGQVLRQYTIACIELGKQALENNESQKAYNYFSQAWDTPDNLGEKYHPLQAVAHINYWKGKAQQAMGNAEKAQDYFEQSTNEQGDFIAMAVSEHSEMTYFRALSLKELGKKQEAKALFQDLKTYAGQKIKEEAKIDYFATSLPLLLVFEDDLQTQNEKEGKFLLGLAEQGLGMMIN